MCFRSKIYFVKKKKTGSFTSLVMLLIAQKLQMLKQDIKTINAEFNRKRALSQLYFTQLRPDVTSLSGLLFSLTLMSKCKKTLETSLDLRPLLKTSVDARVKGPFIKCKLIINSSGVILFKRNMTEKDVCCAHTFSSLDYNFSFRMAFLHRWWLLKVKKE